MKTKVSEIVNLFLFWMLQWKNFFRGRKVKNAQGILIVRFAHIGDFILWLDAAKEFRKIYPGKKITLLCYEYKNIKALADEMGYFDETIIVNTHGMGRLCSLAEMMKKNYEIVINANPSRTLLSDLYILAANAKKRIAPKSDDTCMRSEHIKKSNRIYDQVIDCDDIDTMELVRNGQFISGLKQEKYLSTLPVLGKLTECQLPFDNYFAICPGGETPLKYWEAEKYAEMVRFVFQMDNSIQCIILGTENEIVIADRILNMLDEFSERVVSFSGKTDLLQYIEFIRNAEFIVTNDTSAAHIAAATDTQAYVVAVSWDKGRFHPYVDERNDKRRKLPIALHAEVDCEGCKLHNMDLGNPHCLTNGRMRCISNITVSQVIEAIKVRYHDTEKRGEL